jgi:TetR/AcrR family transcriptional regulator, cholesterol catabolism regulator
VRSQSDRARAKAARTRQRVLDAAAACFGAVGYAGVTLRDIADRAKMKAVSLYYHFDSKDDLVAEVLHVGLENAFTATRAAVEAVGKGTDPTARLRAAITAHLTTVLAESDYATANLRILAEVPEPIRERHLVQQRRYGAFWAGLFCDAVASGAIRDDLDLSLVRMLVLGAINWSVEWYHRGRRTPAEIATQLSTMIFEGLQGRRDRAAAPPARPRPLRSAHR